MIDIDNIHKICRKYYIMNYTINLDGSVDVKGDVLLCDMYLKEIPLKFNKVSGHFDCSDNELTSLKNCPNKVNKYFRCSYCPKLESLEGCPKKVSEVFYCSDCKGKFTANKAYKLCKTPCVYNKL